MKWLLIYLFVINVALAQTPAGNGGDAVVCKKTAEVLDYAEARQLKSLTIQTPPGQDAQAVAEKMLERLKPLDGKLYEHYKKNLDGLKPRLIFFPTTRFKDAKDSTHKVPADCRIEQMTGRQDVHGVRVIQISKQWWSQMAVGDKAGLLLHEIIFEHFSILGEKNAIHARQFNALLASKEISSMNKKSYQEWTRKIGLKFY